MALSVRHGAAGCLFGKLANVLRFRCCAIALGAYAVVAQPKDGLFAYVQWLDLCQQDL